MPELYDIYWGTDPNKLELVAEDVDALSIPMPVENTLDYLTPYYWRVDAKNEYGTTEGDVWLFTTITFKQMLCTKKILPGGDPDGIEGIDWIWTGENNMASVKRVIAAAKNRILIENI